MLKSKVLIDSKIAICWLFLDKKKILKKERWLATKIEIYQQFIRKHRIEVYYINTKFNCSDLGTRSKSEDFPQHPLLLANQIGPDSDYHNFLH